MIPLGNRDDLSRYMQISQVGLEMVGPICLGLALDHYLDWWPWGTVAGAVLGLAGGLFHLVRLANKADSPPPGHPENKSGAT